MLIKDKYFKESVATFALLLMFTTPSIKFLFFSSLVNVIATSLLAYSLIATYPKIKVTSIKGVILIFWFVFFFQFFLLGINMDGSVEIFHLLRYISLFFNIILVTLMVGVINFEKFLNYIGIWSLFICMMNWLGIIEPSGSGELSYLILSMQAALGYLVWLSKLLFYKRGRIKSLIFAIFIFITILSLAGRTSIVSICLLTIFLLFSYVCYNQKISLLWRALVALVIPFAIFSLVPVLLEHVFNEYFIHKMNLLIQGEGDGRFKVYFTSMDLIRSNPLGIGLHVYYQYLGIYPHNIFLEVGLNSGVFAMIQVLAMTLFLFVIFFLNIKNLIKDRWELIALGALAVFTIICWSTSNDFGSASLPLTAITAFIVLYYDRKYSSNS